MGSNPEDGKKVRGDNGSTSEEKEGVEGVDTPVSAVTQRRKQIDLADVRISQDFIAAMGVQKELTCVPVRRPGKQEWFRVRPGAENQLMVATLELEEDGTLYVVSPSLCPSIPGETTMRLLFTVLTRSGVLLLWPCKVDSPDSGKTNNWNSSALIAAEAATKAWIRLKSNRSLGAYEIYHAEDPGDEPDWPDYSMSQLVNLAFQDNYITDLDHPVLLKLRGKA